MDRRSKAEMKDLILSFMHRLQEMLKFTKILYKRMTQNNSYMANDKQTQTMPKHLQMRSMGTQTDQIISQISVVEQLFIVANRSRQLVITENSQSLFFPQVSAISPNHHSDLSLSNVSKPQDNQHSLQSNQSVNLSSQINAYQFIPECNAFLKEFKITDQRFEYVGEDTKLKQVISKIPISRHHPQSIKFKIIRSLSMHLYIGLAISSRLKESHSAKAGGSTISFRPYGKKRIFDSKEHLLPHHLPKFVDGDDIEMLVKYQEQEIIWNSNKQQMAVTKVDFRMMDWHPFVTFKFKGDIVEIL